MNDVPGQSESGSSHTFLGAPAPAAPASTPPELTGRVIGTYEVRSQIGAGGMGEVYLAHDRKLDRPVALKLLSRTLALDADRLRRFHQEARAASSLNHPHILVIHDFGDHEGRPFIVSEFVEGHTLRHVLDARRLRTSEALAFASQIAGALGAAHARGIVHRDVKPENVMVRPDGYVKVLDFGLAKLAGAHDVEAPRAGLTRPGVVMGTPRYMSPEQARGLEVDSRSDVWSVGVILYEMLTGRSPFEGASTADVMAAILGNEPPPIELQNPHIPAVVARIAARALQKNRQARYADGSELAAELAAAAKNLSDEDTDVRGDDSRPSSEISATPRGHQITRTRLIVLPFRLLRPDAEIDFLGFGLADAVSTALSGIDSVIVRSSMNATRFAAADLDPAAVAEAAQVDAVLTGTLLRAGTRLRVSAQLISTPQGTIVWSDRRDFALDDVFKIQDELTERIVDALAVPLTSQEAADLQRDVPASGEAYELYLRGNTHFYDRDNWTIARDLYLECVARDPHFAPAWARLGRCFRLAAKFKSSTVAEMNENLRRADAAFRQAFELNPDLPLAHHLYTVLETDLSRADDAMLRLVRRARRRRADPELYAGLVHACRYCGLLDASVAAHERARALDPQIPTTVAQTYFMRGEFEKAVPAFATHYGYFVGAPLVALGRFDEALQQAEAARAQDPTVRQYQSILPMLIRGQVDECLALLDTLAPLNPDPESVFYIARTYAHLGATARALTQFDRAVRMGFFCYPTFVGDPWLESLRDEPSFRESLSLARRRHEDAARKFCDAGGDRLLGVAAG